VKAGPTRNRRNGNDATGAARCAARLGEE